MRTAQAGETLEWGDVTATVTDPILGVGNAFMPTETAANTSSTSGNTLTVTSDTSSVGDAITGNVYGGFVNGVYNADGSTIRNVVDITTAGITIPGDPGQIASASIYGGYVGSGSGNSTDNTVKIGHGVTIGDVTTTQAGIYGGYLAGTGTLVSMNTVDITGGTIHANLFGGYAAPGADAGVIKNTVNINIVAGSALDGQWSVVSGGYSFATDVTGNNVFITGDATAITTSAGDAAIYGGNSILGDNITGNTVSLTLTGGGIGTAFASTTLYGGQAGNGNASGNSVAVNAARVDEVFGGYSLNIGDAGGNTVILKNMEAAKNIYGGKSDAGTTDGNRVTMNSSTVDNSVYGGYSHLAASNNHVTLTDTNITGNVTGGWRVEIDPFDSGRRNSFGNTVTMTSSTAALNVYGGYSELGDATGNTVTLKETDVTQSIYGGQTDDGIATGNRVLITGGTAGLEVVGGDANFAGDTEKNTVTIRGSATVANVLGGRNTGGNALGNIVSLFDSIVTGTVTGGEADALSRASGNTVNIEDVRVDGDVFGGNGGETKNNKVNISGYKTDFALTTTLWGGSAQMDGNTLSTSNASNMSVQDIRNFEQFDFVLSDKDMGETIYFVANPVDTTGITVNMEFNANGNTALKEGETITLLSQTTGTEADYNVQIKDGFLFNYEGSLSIVGDDNALVFGITSASMNKDTMTFSQAQLAGLQTVNAASDLARDIHSLYSVAADLVCGNPCDDPCGSLCGTSAVGGPVLFAGLRGGALRWNTGDDSRTNLSYMSLLTGLGWRSGNLLLTGYFEAGQGQYDAKRSGRKVVDGEDTKYIGGGIFTRWSLGGFYAEAGGHAGQLKTDFDARFGYKPKTVRVRYDTKATYYGADARVGYQTEVGGSTLDFSAGYTWNRVNGEDFVANDVSFDQDAVNSQRIRAGGQWSYGLGSVNPYVGAHYEYEFDAESSARTNGRRLFDASMKGSSGIGEIGVRFGGGLSNFIADIGVEGYIGKRRGVAGKAMVGFSF